ALSERFMIRWVKKCFPSAARSTSSPHGDLKMQNSLLSVLAFLLAALVSSPASAQAKFDPHDFTGYWLRNRVRPKDHPPLTEAGKKAIVGRHADNDVKLPTDSNDPMYKC